MEGRQTHLGLWTTAHCDRAFQTEGLSEAELLPEHAAIFNLGGWGRPGIALEMTTLYSSP